ncbi:beta-1,3-galactosyltransferase 4 [Zonotrichia albicollis]|uniref:beta-1,3-galactosyltransferase 4 n=1 Tax=Zonotrichia albicollis TaxID=44394 RepID=UPI003D80DC08
MAVAVLALLGSGRAEELLAAAMAAWGERGDGDEWGVLLSPPPCAPPAPFLLILVPSAPPHLQRRLAVRDTWGGPWAGSGAPPARTVFVLGTPGDPREQRELLAESRQHGDILQGDFADSYANLTRKTLLLLRWARACCAAAPFLLKADDDVFVNVPAVATYLATWRDAPARLYLGRVHWRVAPNRDPRSRHYVAEELYPLSRYPPYCSGTAYVLSRRAAGAVLRAGAGVPLALPEDVWVGVAARRAGVWARHSARFGGSARFPPERCCLARALLSAHRVRPRELRGVWGRLPGLSGDCGGLWALLGLLRCRVMALGEGLWGGGQGDPE